jgi:hypothetical protein
MFAALDLDVLAPRGESTISTSPNKRPDKGSQMKILASATRF